MNIENVYYDPEVGFSSIESVYKIVKKLGVTRKDVQKWFQENVDTSVLTEKRKTWKNPILTSAPRELIEADLIDYANLGKANRGYKYILLAIDSFTKKVWLVPLKSKKTDAIIKGFSEILAENPLKLMTDKESGIMSREFQKILRDTKHILNEHAPTAERAIRTIKGKLGRIMTANRTSNWIDYYKAIKRNYNNSFHRTIQMTPNQLENSEFLQDAHIQRKEYKIAKMLPVGSLVRVRLKKSIFDKGYKEKWSRDVRRIDGVQGSFYYVDGKKYRSDEVIPAVETVEKEDKRVNVRQERELRRLGDVIIEGKRKKNRPHP